MNGTITEHAQLRRGSTTATFAVPPNHRLLLRTTLDAGTVLPASAFLVLLAQELPALGEPPPGVPAGRPGFAFAREPALPASDGGTVAVRVLVMDQSAKIVGKAGENGAA